MIDRGGGAFGEVMTISLRQIGPVMLAAGATDAQLDAVAVLMADPTQWFPLWGLMCVRGRAPAT